jgi:hypothetical protein
MPKKKRQEFLNVDYKTNQILLDLVRPNIHEYDFNGYTKFVVNASELANQELFDTLYAQKNNQKAKQPELIEAAKLDNYGFLSGQKRSRNPKAAGLKAGQSV